MILGIQEKLNELPAEEREAWAKCLDDFALVWGPLRLPFLY